MPRKTRPHLLILAAICLFHPTAFSETKYDVRILRDTWGVPHVYGKTDADVAFGLAYAQAEDNFGTMQESLMTSRGMMGMHTGQDGAVTDYIVGLLDIYGHVNAKYETDLSPEFRAVVEAYAAGINYYGEKFPDALLRDDLLPVSGKDIVAGFVFRAPFFVGLDGAIRELFGNERRREVSEKSDTTALLDSVTGIDAIHASHEYLTGGEEMGSNGWVVGPSRSADGSTMLLANPHLAWEGPTTWYEMHAHSEEGWNMTGGLFAGSPLITLGHNENVAWTHTVNAPDLVDIYVLEINPDNENQYKYDGEWLELEESEMTIRVKMTEKMVMPVRRKLFTSIHGPVIKADHGVYAIRYAGFGDIRSGEQWYRMNKATNFTEFKAAMNMRAIHSFNTIYADKDGTVWSLYNAMLPHRTEGYDYKNYLPGNTSETVWDTFLTLDELPQVLNPKSGFVQNNNSDPFMMTFEGENPKREDYSETTGIETRVTNRTLRALELFGTDTSVTWEEFQAYKFDLAYSKESGAAKAQALIASAPKQEDALLQEAIAIVAAWDLETNEDNTSAALAVTTINEGRGRKGKTPESTELDILLDQLGETAAILKKTYGKLDIRWDEFNRIRKGEIEIGIGGGPDILHCVTPRYDESGAFSIGRHGDGYAGLVKWDKDGNLTSRSMHQYGTAVLDADSKHYADQMELMRTRTTKPVWFTEKEIRANLEREYSPYD